MEEYDKRIFSRNLNRYMKQSGKKQADLCALLHVSKSTVSSWCNAQKIPRMDKIEVLANYFGVLKSDLIEEKMPTPVSEDGLDDEKRIFIEKLKSMDSETVAALNKLADSIISKRDQ